MKTLIIEDEVPAATRLKKILTSVEPSAVVLQVCNSIEASVKWLQSNPPPELILMDIELIDGKSFEIFERVTVSSPVVFTTAYDEFAIKAIKFSALDYILKPVDPDELKEAVRKAKNFISGKISGLADYSILQQFVNSFSAGKQPKKIAIGGINGITFISIEKIVRLEANSNYTLIFLSDGKKLTASRTLKEYDKLLSSCGFFRVHHAHLINLSFVEKYIKGDGGYVTMSDGISVEVSRNKKKELLALLS